MQAKFCKCTSEPADSTKHELNPDVGKDIKVVLLERALDKILDDSDVQNKTRKED